jgi:hypothetical protein
MLAWNLEIQMMLGLFLGCGEIFTVFGQTCAVKLLYAPCFDVLLAF